MMKLLEAFIKKEEQAFVGWRAHLGKTDSVSGAAAYIHNFTVRLILASEI